MKKCVAIVLSAQGWKYLGSIQAGKFHGQGKFTWSPTHYYEVRSAPYGTTKTRIFLFLYFHA
jgi:hypothetical protein